MNLILKLHGEGKLKRNHLLDGERKITPKVKICRYFQHKKHKRNSFVLCQVVLRGTQRYDVLVDIQIWNEPNNSPFSSSMYLANIGGYLYAYGSKSATEKIERIAINMAHHIRKRLLKGGGFLMNKNSYFADYNPAKKELKQADFFLSRIYSQQIAEINGDDRHELYLID